MPDNVFEGLDEILKNQKEAQERATLDKEEILRAIDVANARQKEARPVDRAINQRNNVFSLRNFISRSTHEYLWIGTNEDFKNEKKLSIILILCSILSMALCTIAMTASIGFYSTFTLFENIWLFLSFFALAYTCKTKKNYLTGEYFLNSFEVFELDADGVLRNTAYKKKYKVFLILGCVGFVLNAICVWLYDGSARLFVTILELATMALVIFTTYRVADFFSAYGPIRFTGRNESNTQTVSIVLDVIGNKFYTEEEYSQKYPYMLE